jgi:hypothetical protein
MSTTAPKKKRAARRRERMAVDAPTPKSTLPMFEIETKILKALATGVSTDISRECIMFIMIQPLEDDTSGTLFIATDGRTMLFYQHERQRLESTLFLLGDSVRSLKGKTTQIHKNGLVRCAAGIQLSAFTEIEFPHTFPSYLKVIPSTVGKVEKIGLVQTRFIQRFVNLANAIPGQGDGEMLRIVANNRTDPHLIFSENRLFLGLAMPYRTENDDDGKELLTLPAWAKEAAKS